MMTGVIILKLINDTPHLVKRTADFSKCANVDIERVRREAFDGRIFK